MRGNSAKKIKMTSYDDLFGANDPVSDETITMVPISLLHAFNDHPFRVLDDEKMQETVDSIKNTVYLCQGLSAHILKTDMRSYQGIEDGGHVN